MQFQVPQFIEIEDKLVGPLTLKQFLYIAGNCGLAYISYALIPITMIGIVVAIVFLSFGGLLAFYQHNNRPFVKLVSSFFYFHTRPKLYIWKPQKKTANKDVLDISTFKTTQTIITPLMTSSTSRLADMSWQIDV
jgi:hypothetical protein